MTITEYCAMCGEPMTSCYCSPALKPMGTVTMTVTPGTLAPRREDAAGERVAQIAARVNAATLGPWEWHGKRLNGGPANAVGVVSHGAAWDVSKPDAEFIAHSRSDMEYLLAALSTAERKRDAAQSRLDFIRDTCVVYYHAPDGSRRELENINDLDKLWAAEVEFFAARVPSGGEEGR